MIPGLVPGTTAATAETLVPETSPGMPLRVRLWRMSIQMRSPRRFPLGAGLPIQYQRSMHQPRPTYPCTQPVSTDPAARPLRRESAALEAMRTMPPMTASGGAAASVALW